MSFKKKFGNLVNLYSPQKSSSNIFYVSVFLGRRLFHAFALAFLHQFPVAQISSVILSTLLYIIWVFYRPPFRFKINLIIFAIIEIFTLIILCCLIPFLSEFELLTEKNRIKMGNIVIYLIIICFALSTFIVLTKSLLDFGNTCQKKCRKTIRQK